MGGLIQYTTPSLETLYGAPWSAFDSANYYWFRLKAIDTDMTTGMINDINCISSANCVIGMSRDYTPHLSYIVPQVLFYGSDIGFYLNPKATMNYKVSTDLPFKTISVDKMNVDLEGFVDEDTTFNSWSLNQIRGVVGTVTPNPSSSLLFQVAAGNAHIDEVTSVTCDITGVTCYKAKSIPVITGVSANTGFTAGGQLLTLTGFGFNSTTAAVTVDGVTCAVKSFTATSLTCQTGSKVSASVTGNQVGQQGLKREIYNSTTYLSLASIGTTAVVTDTKLGLSLQPPQNEKDGYWGNRYTGYFKAPLTGRYKFYMSCDDQCKL
jgi:hypothetical protein